MGKTYKDNSYDSQESKRNKGTRKIRNGKSKHKFKPTDYFDSADDTVDDNYDDDYEDYTDSDYKYY